MLSAALFLRVHPTPLHEPTTEFVIDLATGHAQETGWRMKYGCRTKTEILQQLSYMIGHAPNNFPPEGGMNMELAWATVEHGLQKIEMEDGRPEVLEALKRVRGELGISRELFDKNEVVPACHKIQDAEDILRPLSVRPDLR